MNRHNFSNDHMKCSKCNLVNTIYYKVIPSNCPNTVFSCCGGNGISVWNHKAGQFECAKCKTPKSTDPSYLGGVLAPDTYRWEPATVKQCECGSTKLGSDKHSTWCPKYE